MDFTLPGKYGAISRIATDGEQTIGLMQFSNGGTFEQEGRTIQQFVNGPYAIWLPTDGQGLTDTPIFIVQQNGVYSEPQYINDICTESGIITTGTNTPDMGGCVSISQFGVYYIPSEAEHTIFTSMWI